MVRSSHWIGDKTDRRIGYNGNCMSIYFFRHQEMEKKAFNLRLSNVVASEILPKRNGPETDIMIIEKLSL